MDPEIQSAITALVVAARGGHAPGISAFLTDGSYSALNPNEKVLVDRVIGRTRFAGKPGAFYLAWRQQSQANGAQQREQVPTATMPSPFDNTQPGGAPGVGPVAGGPPMQFASSPPGPTGDIGSETTPQSIGLNPAAATGGPRDNQTPDYPGRAPAPAAGGGAPGPRDNQTPDYPGRAPAPSAGAPVGAPQGSGSSSGSLPGGFSAATGKYLTEDDSSLLRFAMQAAGFNPDVLTPATKIAMKALQGMVQARRAAFGAGTPGQNVGGLPQDIASFAKEYTTPGADFYGHARDYAQGLMGGKDFQSFIGGLADPMDQYNMYKALTPLLYGGSNPMIQQSISDQLQRQQGLYSDQQRDNAGTPAGNMTILDFIRNQPNLNPALRSIFGPQR
jgi:hypothetical protein